MFESDLQMISIMDNPAMIPSTSDDSSQSSLTGRIQPQQAHWPQHYSPSTNPHHLKNYILDGDEDEFDEMDYEDYGSRPDTPGDPSSPISSNSRSKRNTSNKRNSKTSTKKPSGKSIIFFLIAH